MGFFSGLWKAVTAPAKIIGNGARYLWDSFTGVKQQQDANRTNIALQESANQQNRELSQYQFDRNLEMWNLQNAYNSPESQMQRYIAAGLNPNLASSSNGNASNYPTYESPRMESARVNPTPSFGSSLSKIAGLVSGIAGVASTLNGLKYQNTQIDRLKAETDWIQARANNDRIRANLLTWNTHQAEWLYNYSKNREPYILSLDKWNARNAALRGDILRYQGNQMLWEYNNLNTLRKLSLGASVKNTQARNAILGYQLRHLLPQQYKLLMNQNLTAPVQRSLLRERVDTARYLNNIYKTGATPGDGLLMRLILGSLEQLSQSSSPHGVDLGELGTFEAPLMINQW